MFCVDLCNVVQCTNAGDLGGNFINFVLQILAKISMTNILIGPVVLKEENKLIGFISLGYDGLPNVRTRVSKIY